MNTFARITLAISLVAILMLTALPAAASNAPVPTMETCGSSGLCFEQGTKTSYGYKFLLNRSQAEDWARRMDSAQGVCPVLKGLSKWLGTGCSIAASGMATGKQIRDANAASSGHGVEFGVAMFGPVSIASLVRPRDVPEGIIIVGGNLQVSGERRVGKQIVATFTVYNNTGGKVLIRELTAGARGPNARSRNWNAPNVDFPAVRNITLQRGETYTYRQQRSFAQPGEYFVEPVVNLTGWGGIWPYPRVWLTIQR